MLDAANDPAKLRSGAVTLDRAERQLRIDGKLVPLSALPLRILEQLLLAEGRLVTRAALKAVLWPHALRIDTERRLNTAMRALREALGDTALEPTHVATVRGAGYRWIGCDDAPGLASDSPHRSRFIFAAAAAAALAVLPGSATQPASHSIAAREAEQTRDLAWRLVNQGRSNAARPQLARLIAGGSGNADQAAQLGWLLLRANNPEAALAVCSGPQLTATLNLLSCRQTAFARLGQLEPARSTSLEIMRLAAAPASDINAVAQPAAVSGYAAFLRWRIAHFVPPSGDWFRRAQLQADAGLYAEALLSLRRAAVARDPLLSKIGSSIEFAPLRPSPEFRRIRAKALAEAAV